MDDTATRRTIGYVQSPQVEGILEEWQLTWRLEEQLSLDSVRDNRAQQVREIEHIAIKDLVDQYTEQARNGAHFPPIVVDQNGDLIDGNTRRAMASNLELTHVAAYVVSGLVSVDHAAALGAMLNNLGGERLTKDEAMAAALRMSSLNFTDSQIAQAVGFKTHDIATWRRAQSIRDHAERLGVVEKLEQIKPRQRSGLSKVTLDRPFAQMVDLVASREMTNADVAKVIADVVDAPSEESALAAIAEAQATYRGSGPKAAAAVVNQKARRMRMVLPQIPGLPPLEELYEADRAETDRQLWADALDICQRAIAFYDSKRTVL